MMSYALETVTGRQIEVGYIAGDVSRVDLHEAEAISTPQFAGYAAITLVRDVFPDTARDQKREEWAAIMHGLREKTDAMRSGNPMSMDLGPAHHYSVNPFTARADGQTVCIANRYEVTSERFFSFSYYILMGGIWGWQGATYPEVKNAVVQLDEALAVPPPLE